MNKKATIKFTSEYREIRYDAQQTDTFLLDNVTNTVTFLLKVFVDIVSTTYPNEIFTVMTETVDEKKVTSYHKIKNGEYLETLHYSNNPSDNGDTENIVTKPEWFTTNNFLKLRNYIACINENTIQIIAFSGTFDENNYDLFFKIAHRIACQTNYEYIKYDIQKTFCFKNNNKVLIASLPIKDQEEWFGCNPSFVNHTEKLFNPLHPELQAIYGNAKNALKGYDEGDFALFNENDKMFFYHIWAKEGYLSLPSEKEAIAKELRIKYTVCENMGLPLIEGKETKENPLFKAAQKAFKQDAITYQENYLDRYFGNTNGILMWKIIRTMYGGLKKVTFNLSDYFPIN